MSKKCFIASVEIEMLVYAETEEEAEEIASRSARDELLNMDEDDFHVMPAKYYPPGWTISRPLSECWKRESLGMKSAMRLGGSEVPSSVFGNLRERHHVNRRQVLPDPPRPRPRHPGQRRVVAEDAEGGDPATGGRGGVLGNEDLPVAVKEVHRRATEGRQDLIRDGKTANCAALRLANRTHLHFNEMDE